VQAEIDLLAHKADVRSVSVEAARVRDEVTALRGVVQAMERHLNARIERVEHRLLARLGGLVVVMTGIILAALRYLPLAHE
jgi:hypothetical protein